MTRTATRLQGSMSTSLHIDLTSDEPLARVKCHPWNDPDIARFREALRADPCCYCGGPGGTVEHLEVRGRAGRWNDRWWVGACTRCNGARSRGGRGGRGEHRTLLEMVILRTHERATEAARKEATHS